MTNAGAITERWAVQFTNTTAFQVIGEHVGVIDRGAVTIASPRPSGRLAVLGVFGPDDCIGLPAILARTAYPAEAAALVAGTRVLCLVAAALHHAMASHPACAERVHAALHEHTSALRAKIEVLSAGTAAARLAAFLLYLADRFGAPRADGAVEVPLAVPRVKLADIIAARPETVIRTLGAWRRARLVWTTDDGFVIGARETLATLAERG